MTLREDAQIIMDKALAASLPDAAVEKAFKNKKFGSGRIVVVSIGKAAWQMAKTTVALLGDRISGGIVITKYQHAKGALPPLEIYEAGHPVLDANSVAATARAIDMVKDLGKDDTVLFLISGGGSALFEKPLIPLSELQKINSDLLSSGADIVSMNTVRKRFSAVKGGKFAQICAPANVYAIVLSDIIGDPLDMIASGPAYPDTSTREDAQRVIERYKVILSPEAEACLAVETPKRLDHVETVVTGSVTELAKAGKRAAEALGYRTHILTSSLDCEAREAGSFLAAMGREYAGCGKRWLFWLAGKRWFIFVAGERAGAIKKLRFLLLAGLPVFPTWRSSLLEVTGRMDRPMLLVATLTVRRQPVFWKPVFPFPTFLNAMMPTMPLKNRMAFLLQAQQGPMSTICPCFLLADDDVKKHPFCSFLQKGAFSVKVSENFCTLLKI